MSDDKVENQIVSRIFQTQTAWSTMLIQAAEIEFLVSRIDLAFVNLKTTPKATPKATPKWCRFVLWRLGHRCDIFHGVLEVPHSR
jgi:hypothetical protein